MRAAALLPLAAMLAQAALAEQVTWRPAAPRSFAAPSHAEGQPLPVAGPGGRALRFDGDDSVLVDTRPLVGAATFTIEAVVRPEGGPFAQRFLHMAETDPVTGRDSLPGGTSDPNPRFMFEVRVTPGGWYLDAFTRSAAGQQALVDPARLHPLGRWYVVSQTYDGTTYRAFVDGVLQAEAPMPFAPLGPGRTRIGARMNRIDYFHGSIATIRFTDRALAPGEFLRVPRRR